MIKIFYKKINKSFDGSLSVIVYNEDNTVNEEESIRDIYARSGTRNWSLNPKISGDDPIPDGNLFLWNKRSHILQYNELDAVGRDIGRFYPISDSENQSTTISVNTLVRRVAIGLHDENSFAGSAGCIVVVNNKTFRRMCKLLEKHEGVIIPLQVWTA